MAADTPGPGYAGDAETAQAGLTWQRVAIVVAVIAGVILFWERARTPVIFLSTLGLLIYVHELGHFLAARWAGVRVYEFALGFGPRMVTYMRRQGTDYTIRWAPLGGFVSMKGMEPDEEATPDGLNGKPAFQRAVVYLAGPVMNLFLAIIFFCSMGFIFGVRPPTGVKITKIEPGSAAERIGFKPNDLLLQVNGERVIEVPKLMEMIRASGGNELTFTVQRGAQSVDLRGAPTGKGAGKNRTYQLGVGLEQLTQAGRRMAFGESVERGLQMTGAYVAGFYRLVASGQIAGSAGGPLAIYGATQQTAQMHPIYHFNMMAQLSMSLFIFNLLPIPMLDGGHMLLLSIEVIRRRKLGPEAQRYAQMAGLLVIGTIFILLTFKDVLGFLR